MKFYTTNGEFAPGCPLDQWADELIKGIKKFKLEPEPGPKLKKWVQDAGFENIHHQLLPFPIGQWPKDKKLVLAFPITFNAPKWAYSKHLTYTNHIRLRKKLVPLTKSNSLTTLKVLVCVSLPPDWAGLAKRYKSSLWMYEKI